MGEGRGEGIGSSDHIINHQGDFVDTLEQMGSLRWLRFSNAENHVLYLNAIFWCAAARDAGSNISAEDLSQFFCRIHRKFKVLLYANK